MDRLLAHKVEKIKAVADMGRRSTGLEEKQTSPNAINLAVFALPVVGVRNSHDQTNPAGLVAGTRVFVCDNLAFSGEVRISRKHTAHAMRDLHHLTARAVGNLGDKFYQLDRRMDAYKCRMLNDAEAHDIVIRAVDCRTITPAQIPAALVQWRYPSHQAFRERTAWSLFNAFTEAHKAVNPHTAMRRGEALHGLFDATAGLALAS